MNVLERTTVEIPTDVAQATRQFVEEGAYESIDAIVDHALREWARVQRMDAEKLEQLRQAVREGLDSGPGIPAAEVYARLRASIAARRAA